MIFEEKFPFMSKELYKQDLWEGLITVGDVEKFCLDKFWVIQQIKEVIQPRIDGCLHQLDRKNLSELDTQLNAVIEITLSNVKKELLERLEK